jgi:hypothetical protein
VKQRRVCWLAVSHGRWPPRRESESGLITDPGDHRGEAQHAGVRQISRCREYGPIGTVFAMMAFFIAIGVVIILGAAVGLMWQDRGLSWAAAVRKLRRAS